MTDTPVPTPQPSAYVISLEPIAQACQEAMRHYNELVGDPVLEPWELASEAHRRSMINGVVFVIHRPAASLAEQHQAWCEHKLAEGWTIGPRRDEVARQHPNLVPWDELPREQQMKNGIFRSIVLAMLPHFRRAATGADEEGDSWTD